MGKIHRIKKHFHHIVNQKPRISSGIFTLAHTNARIRIGSQYNGKHYIVSWQCVGDDALHYRGLLEKLIREYNDQAG
jgi:hypothetical protein